MGRAPAHARANPTEAGRHAPGLYLRGRGGDEPRRSAPPLNCRLLYRR